MLVAKIGWLTETVFMTVDWSRWHTYNCSNYNTLILVMRMLILKGWKSNNYVHNLHTYMHVCGKLADSHLNNIATLIYLKGTIIMLCMLIDTVYTNCMVFTNKTHKLTLLDCVWMYGRRLGFALKSAFRSCI